MRLSILIAFLSMLCFADGKIVYENKCASCHSAYIPMGDLKENFVEYNNTKLKLKGPTINQLSFRLKQNIGDPKGDEEFHLMEVSEFVKNYVYNPDKQNSICMDEVIEAFDTMPSMKGHISEAELEEVSEWIYYYDKKSLEEHTPAYSSFDEAVKKAKAENKMIMVKATSEHCHYCKQMDREVLSAPEVLEKLKKGFISVEVDIYKQKLPADLKFKVTPTYFFLDADSKLVKTVPGAWDREDFLNILAEAKGGKK